jgi:hypothetical protein
MVRNTLLQIDEIVIACRKGSILTKFKNKFRKALHACLSTLSAIHAVGQELCLITEKLVYLLPVQSQNWVHSSPDKACPIIIVLEMRAHIVQILDCVKEVG